MPTLLGSTKIKQVCFCSRLALSLKYQIQQLVGNSDKFDCCELLSLISLCLFPSSLVRWTRVQIVPQLEFNSGSRLFIFFRYCFGSLLSVRTPTTSTTEKYHFSCSSSHTVLTFNSFYPQKSLLFPPVRYFKTSITSAMKIKIANMVCSSCSYYFIQLGFRTHEPCVPTNWLGIIVLLFLFVLAGYILFESFLFIFFCHFIYATLFYFF